MLFLAAALSSVLTARESLMEVLSSPERRNSDVVAAIDALELSQKENGGRYASSDFIDFAVAGTWYLEYATRRDKALLSKDFVQVKSISQTVDSEEVSTRAAWVAPSSGDSGVLQIDSAVERKEEPRPHRLLRLKGHYLKPTKKLSDPSASSEIVSHAAASLPYELMQPHLTILEVLYVDPELKILRCTRPEEDVLTCQVWIK